MNPFRFLLILQTAATIQQQQESHSVKSSSLIPYSQKEVAGAIFAAALLVCLL